MRRFLILAMLTLPMPALAQNANCNDDKISDIDSSGRYMSMTSGQVFMVYPGSNTVVLSWSPFDNVSVCQIGGAAYTITDGDRNGAHVKALRQN